MLPAPLNQIRHRLMACFGSAAEEYDIAQLRALTGLGPASVHPSLYALERAGVLRSRWQEEPQPRRRVYSLGAVPYAGRQEVLPYE
jgi:DNA-binding PadR family transcriptional regulator